MTLITWQDGGPLFKDGKVGIEQGCCCGCDCESCSLTVKVNGIPIYVVPAGSPVMNSGCGSFYCDQAGATLIGECAGGPNYTTWCEDYFSTYNPGCPPGTQDGWETTASSCEYRALACLYCSGTSLTVRVAIFTYVGFGCRACDGSFGTSTYVGKAWYRDYVVDRLPACDSEVEMTGGEDVPYDFANDCFMDPHLPGAYPEMTMGDLGCVCDLSVSLSCANPLP